jgi:hypothetical protein
LAFYFIVLKYYKMSFFSLLETFFFISLAVTFILIMMLVYHFKGRLVLLEDKCNTMFEIMNSMVKELKSLHMQIQIQQKEPEPISGHMSSSQPVFSASMPFGGGAGGLFPPELFRLFQMDSARKEMDDNYEIVDDDETEEPEFKRIVVSDTELSDDEEDDDKNVKVINVDINDIDEVESQPLSELEEFVLDEVNPKESEEADEADEADEPQTEEEEEPQTEGSNKVEYRKMDVSYLRTMVLTRGLATDTKKLKKSDLIRLLEEKE